MKILFLIGATSRIRHFDRTILLLADQGHTLVLAGRPRKGEVRQPGNMKHKHISVVANPVSRADQWKDLVEPVRAARDYVRYLMPVFAGTGRLSRRAEQFAPPGFVHFLDKHRGLKGNWQLLERILSFAEELIPSDRGIEAFIKTHKPDVMLVTPLVTFESYQSDYVKAADHLGIPIAFLPFSWDNLSNKGLMRVQPDRTLVWNETQAREAVELHGSAPGSVVVVGAQRFDDFFAQSLSRKRSVFCKENGLDQAQPYILYLCSSALGAPNEVDFVRLWVRELRKSSDPALRTCGVLVRPHPSNKEQWFNADLSDLPNVSVSAAGQLNADQDLFDSVSHSALVVGLNTSAMLEAGILGKHVHTILVPGFDEGQLGTLHFQYLLESNGGLLVVAHSFEEHRQQVAESLRQAATPSAKSLHFIEGFLRPHGLKQPVSPILAGEIEQLGKLRKKGRRMPAQRQVLSALLLRYLQHLLRAPASESVIGSEQSMRPMHVALEALQHDQRPVVVGPWLDDIGVEALFWIPFLRWAVTQYRLDPRRLVIVSRHAAAEPLYADLGGRVVVADRLFPAGDLAARLQQAVPQSEQNPKQLAMAPLDEEVLKRALAEVGVGDSHTLHPLLMFRLLRRLFTERTPERLLEVAAHRSLVLPELPGWMAALPDEFVAVGLPFGRGFSDSPENRAWGHQVIGQLQQHVPIVLVGGVGVDPGWYASLAASAPRRVRIVNPPENVAKELGWQLALAGRAKGLVSTLTGLAYIAPFMGVSTVGYYSEAVPRYETQLARVVFGNSESFGSFEVFRTADFEPRQAIFLDTVLAEKGIPAPSRA